MTDVADRRWGQSLVRAPMAREAVPGGGRVRAERAAPKARPRSEASAGYSEEPAGWDAESVAAWDAAVLGDGRLPATMGKVEVAAPAEPPPTARQRAPEAPPDPPIGPRRPARPIAPPQNLAPQNLAPQEFVRTAAAQRSPAANAPIATRAGVRPPAPPAPARPSPVNGAPANAVQPPANGARSMGPPTPTRRPPASPGPLEETRLWPVVPRSVAMPDDDLAARLGRLPDGPRATATAPATPPADDHRTATGGRVPATPPADARPPATDGRPLPAAAVAPDDETSLARLARGVQDCARGLTSLADRLDGVERRVDALAIRPVASAPAPVPSSARVASLPDPAGLEARLRALEGLSADRLQAFDQRLRQLETLPASVGRLQKDTARLSDLATTRRVDEAAATREVAAAELAPMYQELDSVAELVSSHHAAASQSLERVRTLERAVLEMRRHLERNLAEHARAATAEQETAHTRLQRLEARLAAMESATSTTTSFS